MAKFGTPCTRPGQIITHFPAWQVMTSCQKAACITSIRQLLSTIFLQYNTFPLTSGGTETPPGISLQAKARVTRDQA
jgi:hypothetical protein